MRIERYTRRSREELTWAVLATGAAIITGVVARQAMTAGWRMTRGGEPPGDPEEEDMDWLQTIAWSMGIGLVVGFGRLLGQRWAVAGWRRIKGRSPPGHR